MRAGGTAHTNGSILTLAPDRKTLFTEDILFTDFHPYLADGDLLGRIENLNFIAILDVDRIVPGHVRCRVKKMSPTRRLIFIVFDRLARELAKHGSDAQVIAADPPKRLPVEWMITDNARKKYLSKR